MIARTKTAKAWWRDSVHSRKESRECGAEGLSTGTRWLLGRVPNGYWELRCHRVAYMRWLGQRLGFRHADDWYGLRRQHFRRNFGGGLLWTVYRDSPLAALRDFMPERDWHPWLLCCTPNGFWADRANRRAYMKWLEQQLGIEHPHQWYGVTKADFVKNAGGGLLNGYFGDSVSAAVMDYLPRHHWHPWRFVSVPRRFWLKRENRVAYLDWLKKRLRLREPEEWYFVTTHKIAAHHGGPLVAYHGYSMLNIMRDYLPEVDWKPWLFRRVPGNYWSDPANRRGYLIWLGERMGFQTPSDWCNLAAQDIVGSGGAWLFKCVYGSRLKNVLSERYPD